MERVLVDRMLEARPVFKPQPVLSQAVNSENGQTGNRQESKPVSIELTKRYDKRRVLVYPENIVAVMDDGDDGCTVYFSIPYLEVTESYDEVKRLIEETKI